MPTRKTVIQLAEEKIGFFGYRNRTKPVRRVSEGQLVAFFFLLFVKLKHSYCVFVNPHLNSQLSEHFWCVFERTRNGMKKLYGQACRWCSSYVARNAWHSIQKQCWKVGSTRKAFSLSEIHEMKTNGFFLRLLIPCFLRTHVFIAWTRGFENVETINKLRRAFNFMFIFSDNGSRFGWCHEL